MFYFSCAYIKTNKYSLKEYFKAIGGLLVIFSITLSPLVQAAQEKVGCPTDSLHDSVDDIDSYRELGYIERACRIEAIASQPYDTSAKNDVIYVCNRAMTLRQASAICKQLVTTGLGDLIAWGFDLDTGYGYYGRWGESMGTTLNSYASYARGYFFDADSRMDGLSGAELGILPLFINFACIRDGSTLNKTGWKWVDGYDNLGVSDTGCYTKNKKYGVIYYSP